MRTKVLQFVKPEHIQQCIRFPYYQQEYNFWIHWICKCIQAKAYARCYSTPPCNVFPYLANVTDEDEACVETIKHG
jgi:hypothetical protein